MMNETMREGICGENAENAENAKMRERAGECGGNNVSEADAMHNAQEVRWRGDGANCKRRDVVQRREKEEAGERGRKRASRSRVEALEKFIEQVLVLRRRSRRNRRCRRL